MADGEGIGLLLLRTEHLPLIEAGGGDEAAAAALEGFAPRRLGGDGLGFGIEGGEAFERGKAFGEEGNQAPAHEQQLAHSSVAAIADDGLKGGRATL